jgi:site-specific recombinase XerD
MDIKILLDEFCQYSTFMKGYSKHTITRYRNSINFFIKHTNITRLNQINEKLIFSFMMHGRTEREWSAYTFISYHVTLTVFFRYCIKKGLMEKNYMESIELPRLPKRLPKRISKQDALRLLEIAYNYPYPYTFLRFRNQALFATFLYCGLRKSELLGLKLNDVDLENLTMMIRQGKGDKDRIIPISFTLAQILKKYLLDRKRLKKTCPEFFASLNTNYGLTVNGLKHLNVKMRKASKIYFTWHMLRHTFATLMIEGGCDIFSLSKMMGHSDIKTTTIYLSASTEHLREQVVKHPLEKTFRTDSFDINF